MYILADVTIDVQDLPSKKAKVKEFTLKIKVFSDEQNSEVSITIYYYGKKQGVRWRIKR